jgi:uncharacterized alpha-E superfamily protein
LISRVADNCFWFGRYVERAESTARLLAVTRELVFDADLPPEQCWQPLVIVSGQLPTLLERDGAAAAGQGEVVQRYITWNPDNGVSLLNSVRAAREIARTIREVLSIEVWEEVNELYLWISDGASEAAYANHREDFYRKVRRSTQLCLGLVRSTMLHDEPMRFLWLGVMLERVGQTARILDMHHHTLSPATEAGDSQQRLVELNLWLSLLRACSGFDGFMKRHRGRVTREGLVSFLVFESQFPRSLRYCLRSALGILGQLYPPGCGDGVGVESLASLEALCRWLDKNESATRTTSIHDLLTDVVDRSSALCSIIQREMLGPERPSHAEASAQ